MTTDPQHTLVFQRAQFLTHLPLRYRYTLSHLWVELREEGRLRVGFTRFATRMLGELVDHNFETESGAVVRPGQVLGWVEGFKGISDVLCVGQGRFAGGNPALNENIGLANESAYNEGWLYEIDGQVEEQALDVHAYAEHLRVTIDRLAEQRRLGGPTPPEGA